MPISTRRVRPSGPVPCRIAYIGEGPGAEEDERGLPFIGKSGKVLWEMSQDYVGITRKDVYVDNLSPFRLTDNRGKDRAPTPEEAERFAPELWERLANVGPELVVTLGRHSTSALLGFDIAMEIAHGRLYESGGPAVLPCYHPAAGLHDPTLLAYTAADLQVVGRYLKGERDSIRAAANKETPQYATVRAVKPVIPIWSPCAIDTEYDPITGDPWCLTFSDIPGNASLIRADDHKTLEAFRRGLERSRPEVILHFALADIEPLRRMGIDLIAMGLKIRDTGIELFLTQLNPQGLKRSAQRLVGMHMRDYEDVVGPVAEKFLRDHLTAAIAEPPAAWGLGEGRKWSILKRVEGMIHPRKTAGTEPRSLREKWADEDFAPIRAQIEASIGPAPRPTIDDIPSEEFRDYACADADATRRQSYPLHDLMVEHSLTEIHRVDHGVIPIVDRMQQVGLRVDTHRLDELRDYVKGELDAYLEICRILTGQEDFNPGSGDQIAAFCQAQDLGLTKLTKGGKRIQVDENALIAIRYAHPAIESFLTYRELDKLQGTYIEPLYGLLVGAGRYRRLYGHFRLTAAITGRLAMFDPNLMAFPTRTEVGRRLRRCFVAGPGRRIGSCDLSQIELRVGAALSQDERMVDAFVRGADIHLETAVSMFDLPVKEIDEMLHRYPAKCFHPDTEVLTRSGWKKITDLTVEEEVIQAVPSRENIRLEWVRPLEVFTTYHPSQELIHFSSEGINLRVTPDHRMLYFTPGGKNKVVLAEEMLSWGNRAGYVRNSGILEEGVDVDRRLIRLAVATQADGSYSWKRIRFGFTRLRKILRMRKMLTGFDYTEAVSSQGATTFCLSVELSKKIQALLDPDKTLPWSWLGFSSQVRRAVVAEAEFWDSHRGEGWRQYTYCSFIEKNLEVLQALAASVGRRTSRGPNRLSVKDKGWTGFRGWTKRRLPYSDKVACLSVPSSFVLVRDGGVPVVVGQTTNFAMFFGAKGRRLNMEFLKAGIPGWNEERCDGFVEKWFDIYAGVAKWIEDICASGARDGFVRTAAGRMRYLPALRFHRTDYPFNRIREEAERHASNFPVQGTAQEIEKRGMKVVWDEVIPAVQAAGYYMEPLLQLHDEMLFEFDIEAEEIVKDLVIEAMTRESPWRRVPIKASWKSGLDWGQAK